MATVNGGAFTVSRGPVTIYPDGSTTLVLNYVGANNIVVSSRVLFIPANQASPIVDQYGNQVSATVPGALATATASYTGQIDTTISNGATGGKLNM
jgi:3-oxoacyl-[acyl-carrier-protein] synthase III